MYLFKENKLPPKLCGMWWAEMTWSILGHSRSGRFAVPLHCVTLSLSNSIESRGLKKFKIFIVWINICMSLTAFFFSVLNCRA